MVRSIGLFLRLGGEEGGINSAEVFDPYRYSVSFMFEIHFPFSSVFLNYKKKVGNISKCKLPNSPTTHNLLPETTFNIMFNDSIIFRANLKIMFTDSKNQNQSKTNTYII